MSAPGKPHRRMATRSSHIRIDVITDPRMQKNFFAYHKISLPVEDLGWVRVED